MRSGANAGTEWWSRLQLNGAGSRSLKKKQAHKLTMSRRCVSKMCNGGVDVKDRRECIIGCEEE